MRLTTFTDYALRTLMYLALNPDRLVTIAEVSGRYGISSNHMMKIVHQLGLAGYIETVRGKSGGMRLARPPGQINLGDVVRRMEPDLELVPCFGAAQICTLQPSCVLQQALRKALTAFLKTLDGFTLADLTRPRTRLSKLLLAGPPKSADLNC